MKTVLAQGRKDLAGNSILLWVWAICVGIDCLCFLTRLHLHSITANEPDAGVLFGSLLGGITIVLAALLTQLLLAIVLLVRIVQADSLIDSAAFWRTRPVARHQLLAAKTLFAVLFLTGGYLAWWAIPSSPGAPPSSNGTVFLGTLVFVSGVFAFAAVTSDFSKFLLASLGLAWGAMIVAAIVLALLKYLAFSAGTAGASWPIATPSFVAGEHGHLIISLFYLLAFVAIIIWQYLTLRTRVSRTLLFATFFIVTLLQGSRGHIEFHSSRTSHVRGP